jgi:hypothetical protein
VSIAFSVDVDDKVAALTAEAATIERRGNVLRFYRRPDNSGAVAAWSLCEIEQ